MRAQVKDERLRVSFFGAVTSLCKVPTKGRNWWHQFLCLSDPSLVAGEPGHEAPPAEFKMHVFLPQVNTRNPTRNYSRIPLYHPRHTSSSRLYWPFSAGTDFFYIIKPPDISPSPPVISATLRGARGNIGALRAAQIALIARCGCLRDTFAGSHSHTCLQTQVIVFHSCKMAPTKRTSLTWKEKVV